MRVVKPKAEPQSERPAGPEPELLDSPLGWDQSVEETFAGWALAHPEHAHEVIGTVKPAHFYGFLAKSVMQGIEACTQKNEVADLDGVFRALERLRIPDITRTDLIRLYGTLPLHWIPMAQRIRDAAHRRLLGRALVKAQTALAHEDLADVRATLYRAIDAAEDTEVPIEDDRFDAVMAKVWERFHLGEAAMIATGFKRLDQFTKGVPRKALFILGARTSVGKTALACTMACDMAERGLRVSYISAEMDQVGIGQRYVGVLSGIPVMGLSTGHLHPSDEAAFAEASAKNLPIATDDTARTVTEVRARVLRHRRLLGGLDVIFVDYLQLLGDDTELERSRDEKRHLELGRISRALKRMAKDLNCVVFALAQLSRASESRREPSLKDLRESGDLEQDADGVWLLWRDERSTPPRLRLKVAKFRQGPTGKVDLNYQSEATRFSETVEDAPDPEPEPPKKKPKATTPKMDF